MPNFFSFPMVVVRFQIEGFHNWTKASGERAYLAQRHRHLFHFEIGIAVFYDDREIEFHDFLAFLREAILLDRAEPIEFGGASCEMIARSLIQAVHHKWPGRKITASVFEDGEMGATLTWEPDA